MVRPSPLPAMKSGDQDASSGFRPGDLWTSVIFLYMCSSRRCGPALSRMYICVRLLMVSFVLLFMTRRSKSVLSNSGSRKPSMCKSSRSGSLRQRHALYSSLVRVGCTYARTWS